MDKIFSPIKGRIIQFIERQSITKDNFFEKTGVSASNFKGKGAESELGGEKIAKILTSYPELNPSWLITGEGAMLRTEVVEVSPLNTSVFNVKLVGQYAYAGYLNGFSDPEYMETLPTVPFLIPEGQTTRGQYLAFEVRGDSMDDGSTNSIVEYDIVLGRLIAPHFYDNSKLHYKKWYFIIVHEHEGVIIKQITAHDVENKTITVHSLNELYADRVIHLGEVKRIYNVVQLLRKSKPYPTGNF
jgi:phage repressor protein C with HTH and peptisase S24 domain